MVSKAIIVIDKKIKLIKKKLRQHLKIKYSES
jgi:hypothetical protein